MFPKLREISSSGLANVEGSLRLGHAVRPTSVQQEAMVNKKLAARNLSRPCPVGLFESKSLPAKDRPISCRGIGSPGPLHERTSTIYNLYSCDIARFQRFNRCGG